MEIIVNGKKIELTNFRCWNIKYLRGGNNPTLKIETDSDVKFSEYEKEKFSDRVEYALNNFDKLEKEIETLKSANETLSINHDEFMRLKDRENELIGKIQVVGDFKTTGIERIKELEEEKLKLRCCGNCANEECFKNVCFEIQSYEDVKKGREYIDTCTLNRMKFWKGE